MMTIYNKSDIINDEYEFTCCLYVEENEYDRLLADFSHEEIFMGRYDATDTLKITHKWKYHYLWNSWTLWYMYVKSEKLTLNKSAKPIEVYQNRLEEIEDEELVTEIHIPILN